MLLTRQDLKEIGYYTFETAIKIIINDPDVDEASSSDSDYEDLSDDDFDFRPLCEDITPTAMEYVEDHIQDCAPLTKVYPEFTASAMKIGLQNVQEPSQCRALHLLSSLSPGEDRSLMDSCGIVAYWCCCNALSKVSPLISEATLNLIE